MIYAPVTASGKYAMLKVMWDIEDFDLSLAQALWPEPTVSERLGEISIRFANDIATEPRGVKCVWGKEVRGGWQQVARP